MVFEQDIDNLVSLRLLTRNLRLVKARKEKGLRQADVAMLLKIPIHYIGSIELLKILPTEDQKAEFASCLEKSVDYLFPEILMNAIEQGVFNTRYRELKTPEIISLAEAERLRLTYDGETEIIDDIARKELAEQVNDVIGTLTKREQTIIRMRFGFDEQRPKTLEETGIVFNITRESIRKIEGKALRKLRHPRRSRLLKSYLD